MSLSCSRISISQLLSPPQEQDNLQHQHTSSLRSPSCSPVDPPASRDTCTVPSPPSPLHEASAKADTNNFVIQPFVQPHTLPPLNPLKPSLDTFLVNQLNSDFSLRPSDASLTVFQSSTGRIQLPHLSSTSSSPTNRLPPISSNPVRSCPSCWAQPRQIPVNCACRSSHAPSYSASAILPSHSLHTLIPSSWPSVTPVSPVSPDLNTPGSPSLQNRNCHIRQHLPAINSQTAVQPSDRSCSLDKSLLVRPHVCMVCQRAFARANDLLRHRKSHRGDAPFRCPFFTRWNSSQMSCHQTGRFSRCDTFKNHLKAVHFDYPMGTRKRDRSRSPGKCRACQQAFPSADRWYVEHIETSKCLFIQRNRGMEEAKKL